ncbi:hypothetical protein D6C86_02555 [Aureobasidium pullulans]|uniref:Uncharacterized protein n=1 Tax=Aureobasidium pullulans TaxID=5580 RepID=A0A4S9PVA2_AURPU|nr:hypothetical protein D6C94_04496 [Aureobasidium pullulans]THZ60966.1 hypothetical protein D6C88_08745 [Aureobasidium pullulans]THZ64433.1 hypothetical protein D6C86_02555 [Aureobasidium pullulans]
MSRNTELEEKVAQMEKAAKIQRDVAAVINERAIAARDFQKSLLAQVAKYFNDRDEPGKFWRSSDGRTSALQIDMMSDANPNLVQDSEISGPINVVLEDKIKRLTGDVERLTALAKNDSNTIKLQQVRIRYLMKKIAKMKGATKIREEILVLEERLEAGRKKNEDELLVLQEQRDVDDELFNREEELRMVEEDEEEE